MLLKDRGTPLVLLVVPSGLTECVQEDSVLVDPGFEFLSLVCLMTAESS